MVLHARESIHHINELAAAFGTMTKEDRMSFTSELNRLAARDEPPMERPKSMAEFATQMGGMTKIATG